MLVKFPPLLLSLALLCATLSATPAPAGKIFPYPYTHDDLPNGLRLVTIPTDSPNIVAVYIVVQTGSRNEVEPGKTGFAHLFEHMMFRGTEAYPPSRFEAELKRMGAASNAYTTDDHTAYHTVFSKEDLEALLKMEADRFQNLKYTEDVFKTEALAVLGEYNKNASNPVRKILEVLRGKAFKNHTYRHTTMGFIEDVKNMPQQYQYSLQFFDRYYRPEYTTIIVAGDVHRDHTRALVEKYWGGWKRGSHKAAVPAEPPQKEPAVARIDWPNPTLPWVTVAFRGPAYSDTEKDMAALDAISFLGFSENSELYQRLVIREQKVDTLSASNADHVDPYLFAVMTRVKKESDMEPVRDEILATLAGFAEKPVPAYRLEKVKRHLRSQFSLGMDNTAAMAANVAHYVSLRRTPETINRLYDQYANLNPEDIQKVARKYFVESGRTIVTLTGGKGR
ncbi:MAG: pitrilysin family protein [Bryobacteraceae bacterium]